MFDAPTTIPLSSAIAGGTVVRVGGSLLTIGSAGHGAPHRLVPDSPRRPAVIAWPEFPPGSRRDPVPQQHPPVLCDFRRPLRRVPALPETRQASSCDATAKIRPALPRPLAQSGVHEAVDVADDHGVRRADHQSRAAADRRGAAARDAVADGRAGRARDAAVRARQPARRRADRPRAQAADRDRRRRRARCRAARHSRRRLHRARCRSRSCTRSASSAACRTSSAAPRTRCCSRRWPGAAGWSRRTPRSRWARRRRRWSARVSPAG